MARRTIPVDKADLTAAIQLAEENGPLQNLSALWKEAASIYNQGDHENISFSIVGLRVKEWEIPHVTKAGKRGGDGSHLKGVKRGPRKSKEDKFKKNQDVQASLEQMREMLRLNEAERFMPLVDQIEKGSRAAAVKLNCLQCCAFMTKEVRLCGCGMCPIWPFRPYQGALEQEEQEEQKEAA